MPYLVRSCTGIWFAVNVWEYLHDRDHLTRSDHVSDCVEVAHFRAMCTMDRGVEGGHPLILCYALGHRLACQFTLHNSKQ